MKSLKSFLSNIKKMYAIILSFKSSMIILEYQNIFYPLRNKVNLSPNTLLKLCNFIFQPLLILIAK